MSLFNNRLLIITKKFIALTIIVFYCNTLTANSLYLLDPTRQDLIQLAEASPDINAPLAVPFVFHRHSLEFYMGIPISNRVRNGVHARLLVEYGLVDNLSSAKSSLHSYEAGTIFLEVDSNGKPYLSIHQRNSFVSTINDSKVPYNLRLINPFAVTGSSSGVAYLPEYLLQKISNKYHLPIKLSSEELFDRINNITAHKYSARFVKSYFKKMKSKIFLKNEIYPISEKPTDKSRSSSPELVEAILTERVKLELAPELVKIDLDKIRNSGVDKVKRVMCRNLF